MGRDHRRIARELSIACALLAGLGLMAGAFLMEPPPDVDAVMSAMSHPNLIAWGMMGHGLVMATGLLVRRRVLRQWGLALGGLTWVAFGATLLNVWATLITVSAVTSIGLLYVVLLILDVRRKPRCNP